MIYWFVGQSGSGKSTLADLLHEKIDGSIRIDGDNIRELFSNKDYSLKGRVYNVDIAQKIAHFSYLQNKIVIVSLVTPYIDQREEFKKLIGLDNFKEILIKYDKKIIKRGREQYHVEGFQEPLSNFITIDTTNNSINDNFKELYEKIKK